MAIEEHQSAIEILLAKIKKLEDNPANLNKSGRVWPKYTPYATRRIDDLRRSVAYHTREIRLLRGETVNDAGYSGRQTNRR